MTVVLKISRTLNLPLQAATETFAILAVRRAGKSNSAVVMAEEMYDAGIPWVAVDPKGDWWGVRAAGEDGSKPGLSVVVFGGEHGDVPLEPTGGALVADLVAKEGVTCVLDVSDFPTKADQRRFLTDFATRLYKAKKPETGVLHVFCEEADEYIPQRIPRGNERMVGAFETLVKRGGFKGIGITMVTQRSASLNKDVLTQAGTLIAMRTPSPQDRKAIRDWVDFHDAGKDLVEQIPTLGNGEAFVFSPEWLKIVQRIKFRRRRTFDSGRTPEVGEQLREPTRLADVDLDAITKAMADTIERVKADDPRVLRQEISKLRSELESAQAAQPEPRVEIVEVDVLDPELVKRLEEILMPSDEARELLERLSTAVQNYREHPEPPPQSPPFRPAQAPARPAPPAAESAEDIKIGKTERNILTVLAQFGPRTHRQLALQTGYSAKASTIGVSAGKLRKAGYLEPGGSGMYAITQKGIQALGDWEPLPTGQALLDFWMNYFGKTEKAVLEVIVKAWPGETSLQEICDRTGYSPTASTVGVSLGKLRRVEIVDGWKLTDDFARGVGL